MPEEFIAEENIHQKNYPDAAKVREDNNTVKTSNRSHSPELQESEEPSPNATKWGHSPLTHLLKPLSRRTLRLPSPPTKQNSGNCTTSYSLFCPQTNGHKWEIVKQLRKIKPPTCSSCLFGMMTKLPWHSKEAKSSHELFFMTNPEQCALVDQLVSMQVKFYAQLKGKLTNRHYHGAAFFLDHYSCLHFVHLMQDSSSNKTIKAKHAFEQFAADHSIKTLHYHCDNGQFGDSQH